MTVVALEADMTVGVQESSLRVSRVFCASKPRHEYQDHPRLGDLEKKESKKQGRGKEQLRGVGDGRAGGPFD